MEPLAEGKAFIGEAGFNNGADVLIIEPITVTVVSGSDEDITMGRKYGFSQIIQLKDSTNQKLDSLKQKLKKVLKTVNSILYSQRRIFNLSL